MVRELKLGEKVFDVETMEFGIITKLPNNANRIVYDSDADYARILTIQVDNDDIFINNLYKINEAKTKEYGYTICDEFQVEDYPYYIPERDENAYEIELEAMCP